MDPIYETEFRHRGCREREQRLKEEVARLKAELAEASVEIERLRTLVRTGDEHEEDCEYRNLSGDLTCNCAGGRANGAKPQAGRLEETAQREKDVGLIGKLIVRLSRLSTLTDELCTSVECAEANIGGQRGALTIIGEIGPETDAAREALARAKEAGFK